MIALLGYIGYALIVVWTPIQLVHMLRGHPRELGRLPLVTLVLGLACLQASFGLDRLPLYTQVGNGVSLFFTSLTLAVVSWQQARGTKPGRPSPKIKIFSNFEKRFRW